MEFLRAKAVQATSSEGSLVVHGWT